MNRWCVSVRQTVRGRPLQSLVTLAGGHIVPGAVADLPFAADVHGTPVSRGYRLPIARRAIGGDDAGLQDVSLPWEGLYSQRVTDPTVTLMICDAPGQGTPPGGGDSGQCDDFRGLKPSGSVTTLQRPRMTISIVAAGASLQLVDSVDQSVAPPRLGGDGSAEVLFPDCRRAHHAQPALRSHRGARRPVGRPRQRGGARSKRAGACRRYDDRSVRRSAHARVPRAGNHRRPIDGRRWQSGDLQGVLPRGAWRDHL